MTNVLVCPNSSCQEYVIKAFLYKTELVGDYATSRQIVVPHLLSWQLLPQSNAKVYPEYTPSVIRQDYTEACLIKSLSPKASATLSRRCLQGIIRDYWGVSRQRLIDEINAIQDKIDPITWQAVDAVRKVGNIGAHMEKDINVIVDVDPDEAQLLISLIELLFKDLYVTRHQREEQLNAIIKVATDKETLKKLSAA